MAKSISHSDLEVNLSANKSKRELIREKRKEEKRRKSMLFIFAILAVVVIFILAALMPGWLANRASIAGSEGFVVGDPNAPVTVTQFSSYTCSFCKQFSENEEKGFIAEYVDTGKVFYRFVNIPANNEAGLLGAEASYCAADQNRFFDYKDYLYTYAAAADGFSLNNLTQYAQDAGLDTAAFEECMASDTFANAYDEDVRFAQSVGITGTPSFLVNGQLVYSTELVQTVEEALAEQN